MPALPPASDFTAGGTTEGTFKAKLTTLLSYLSTLLGSAGTQPAALSALGAILNGTLAKTAAYTVVAADRGKLIDCSGSWTLAIDGIATLGAGFAFAVRNSGGGSITINPNLSETINTATSYILGPDESCVVVPDTAATGWLVIFTGGGGGSSSQVSYFPMNAAPTGWLKANGALISRTSYAALFAKIGTTFGAGDGSTSFALPDLRGEFIRGWDDARGVDSGRAFGDIQGDAFRSHTHGGFFAFTSGGAFQVVTDGSNPPNSSTFVTGTAASGGAETRPRNISLLACIKY